METGNVKDEEVQSRILQSIYQKMRVNYNGNTVEGYKLNQFQVRYGREYNDLTIASYTDAGESLEEFQRALRYYTLECESDHPTIEYNKSIDSEGSVVKRQVNFGKRRHLGDDGEPIRISVPEAKIRKD